MKVEVYDTGLGSYGLKANSEGKPVIYMNNLGEYVKLLEEYNVAVATMWLLDENIQDDLKVSFMQDMEKYGHIFLH